ncbi:MAG: hypothetical protein LH645_03075 [Actinomycetia bacterium]|nr:hypothetical protein [Actinomycetes bacterium]
MDDNTQRTHEHVPREPFWAFDLGLPEIIAPYVDPTAFAAYRALRDDGARAAKAWDQDLLHYTGLGASEAAALLSALDDDQLSDRQNFSPTLRTFLQSAVDHPDEVELHG